MIQKYNVIYFYDYDSLLPVWSDVLEVSFMTPDEEIVMGLVMSF